MVKTMIIAEAGVNHNGDIQVAKRLVEVAAQCGADVVKFQTFKASSLATASAGKAEYQKKLTKGDETQQQMLRGLELSEPDHIALRQEAEKHGIEFLSSPFDIESAVFLVEDLGLKQLKIPSGEITNAPLLYEIAKRQVPVILSTGMSDMTDIRCALAVLAMGYQKLESINLHEILRLAESKGAFGLLQNKVTLLHCTSDYPAQLDDVNLRAMDTLREVFGLSVGYSDHTDGIVVSLAAVARGAVCVEKHFTLDKTLPGPDHRASLEPGELKNLVTGIRAIEKCLGDAKKKPTAAEESTRRVARKSLVAHQALKKGDLFTTENIRVKRPGIGLSPLRYWDLLGCEAKRDYSLDDLISEDEI